jgi:hypothetical protein
MRGGSRAAFWLAATVKSTAMMFADVRFEIIAHKLTNAGPKSNA